MISLYPFHIHISFPYSHILPYPYISHIPVFIFLSIPPVALPLVFFIFHFCGMKGGVCFSCDFLVSVLWMVFGLFLAPPLVSPFVSSRPSFRSSPRFDSRFVFRPALRSALLFVFPFGRVGGRFVGRAVFVSSLGAGGRLFFFRVLIPWGDVRACRIVDGVGSVDGVAGRLCGAYSVSCGWAWGVSLGEALSGAWWRLRDMRMVIRMAGRLGQRRIGNGRRDDNGR